MGKDVNKKFTVNLDISTEEAEKQVKASAENIKKILQNAMKDGINTKELRNMAETINSLFTGIGKTAPLDIEKHFKGNGNAAKRVQILIDALNDLSNALGNVGSKGIDIPGLAGNNFSKIIKEKVKEFYDAQIDGADLDKLDAIKQSLKEALSIDDVDFGDITSVFKQLELGDIEEDQAVNSIKSIVESLKSVKQELNSTKGNIQNNGIVNGFKNITQEAKKTEDATKKVMYHLGNLFGGGKKADTFGEMPYNLTDAALGSAYEQYGFGVLGGGLFGVSNPNTIADRKVKGTNFIQSIDLSKYNMYMANTEERAASLMDFLSKLQKFAMKTAEPNYTGFDDQLQGLDVNSLYQQFQTVFTETDLTKDKFNEFINQMVDLLKQAGLKFDEDGGYLDFTSLGDLGGTENISTRFMKMLGYQGVNVGGTSFDGFGQGSVLFDFNESDIVGFFNTVESAIKDYENIAGQIDGKEWIGTSEQLEQYGHNIDEIIARVKEYINVMTKGNWSQEAIQGANQLVARLEQVRINIDGIKSGTGLSDSQFADITSSNKDMVSGESTATEFEKIGDAAQEAEAKVESFLTLSKSLIERYDFKDVEIGQFLAQLDAAKNELQELANQGVITEQQMDDVFSAHKRASDWLDYRLDHNETERNDELESLRDEARYAESRADSYAGDAAVAENKLLEAELRANQAELRADRATERAREAEERAADAVDDMRAYQEAFNEASNARTDAEMEAEQLRAQLSAQGDHGEHEKRGLAIYEDADGQLALFDGLSASAEHATTEVQELEDAVKRVDNLDGQMSLFDDDTQVAQEQKVNNALQEQVNLEKQVASADQPRDTGDLQVIQQENDALREQKQLEDSIDSSKEATTKKTKSKITPEQKWDTKLTTDSLTKYQGELRSAVKKLDFNLLDTNLTSQQQEIVDSYKEIVVQIEKTIKAVKNGEQVELSSIQETVAALRDKIKVYKEQNNISELGKKKENQSNKNYGSSVEIREMARFNKLNKLAIDPRRGYSTSTSFMNAFNEYKNAYDQLIAKRKQFEETGNITKEDEVAFKNLTDECTKCAKALENAINVSEKLERGNTRVGSLGKDFVDSDKGRKQALTDYIKQIHEISAASITFDKNYTKATYTVKNSDGTFSHMTATLDSFKNQIVETTGQTKKATGTFEGFLNELGGKIRSIGTYLISMIGFQEVFQQIRQGITYVKEIDSALTELKKVTNETGAEYDAFLQSMSKTASVVGSTVSELTTMAAEWARLGYTMEEAGKLAESTAILLNVSEFEDATTASEALISTMQAFQYTADESQHVVDILNEVGKLLPVDNYNG